MSGMVESAHEPEPALQLQLQLDRKRKTDRGRDTSQERTEHGQKEGNPRKVNWVLSN